MGGHDGMWELVCGWYDGIFRCWMCDLEGCGVGVVRWISVIPSCLSVMSSAQFVYLVWTMEIGHGSRIMMEP